MQLTTPVEARKSFLEITHRESILLLGSCFAQNIGNRLLENKFPACVNPFGTLYNPLSIATALHRIVTGEEFTHSSPEIFESGEKWHSILHHGDYSRSEKSELLVAINESLRKAHEIIRTAGTVILTFGTAYVYVRKSDNCVAGNCHKLPATLFTRKLLSINEIVETTAHCIDEILGINSDARILFTVSPIRHLRDGAHDNQKSKATLLLAIDELQKLYPTCTAYFPAYEIMLDELRDYRFYAEDMAHPSPLAVEYIWERFTACHIAGESNVLCKEIAPITRALAHRPFDERSSGYKEFIGNTLQKIETIKEKHPYIDFEKEIEKCNIQLSK